MHTDFERRKNERIPCETPILHNTSVPDFFFRGTMYNFSLEGLYFESNEDLLEGHQISIAINKPPRQFMKKSHQHFDVKIIWCQELQESAYHVGYGAKLI